MYLLYVCAIQVLVYMLVKIWDIGNVFIMIRYGTLGVCAPLIQECIYVFISHCVQLYAVYVFISHCVQLYALYVYITLYTVVCCICVYITLYTVVCCVCVYITLCSCMLYVCVCTVCILCMVHCLCPLVHSRLNSLRS